MSYLSSASTNLPSEFMYDVFISYPHADVLKDGDSELRAWEIRFEERLRKELAISLEIEPAIFFDASQRDGQGLRPVGPLAVQLQDAAARSAFLMILMSKYYLRSTWCGYERAWWRAAEPANRREDETDGKLIEDRKKLRDPPLVVRIMPTQHGDWPADLKSPVTSPEGEPREAGPDLGFWLHDRGSNQPTARPFGWYGDEKDLAEFRKRINEDICTFLVPRLRDVRTALERRRETVARASKLAAGTRLDIYVHAPLSQSQRFDLVCEALDKQGHIVTSPAVAPELGSPKEIDAFIRGKVTRILSGSDVLLLIPTPDPFEVAADLTTFARARREAVRANAPAPLPCALLDHVGKPIQTERLRTAAQRLSVDWLATDTPSWPDQVNNWLTTIGTS